MWGLRSPKASSNARREKPSFAADSRSPRDGKFLEIIGRYNPQTNPSLIELDEDKVKTWLGKGALPTEAVARLIKVSGIS